MGDRKAPTPLDTTQRKPEPPPAPPRKVPEQCGVRSGYMACERPAGHGGSHRGYNEAIDEAMFWPAQSATLTPRDYFAAAALSGFLAHPNTDIADRGSNEIAARVAYEYADAMLSERGKQR